MIPSAPRASLIDFWKKEVWNAEFWFWKLLTAIGLIGLVAIQLAMIL